MRHHIKHSQDALRLLEQDFARDRLVEFARKGDDPIDSDILTGHARARARDGFLTVVFGFSAAVVMAVGAAILMR